jgi:hypothetical protein
LRCRITQTYIRIDTTTLPADFVVKLSSRCQCHTNRHGHNRDCAVIQRHLSLRLRASHLWSVAEILAVMLESLPSHCVAISHSGELCCMSRSVIFNATFSNRKKKIGLCLKMDNVNNTNELFKNIFNCVGLTELFHKGGGGLHELWRYCYIAGVMPQTPSHYQIFLRHYTHGIIMQNPTTNEYISL